MPIFNRNSIKGRVRCERVFGVIGKAAYVHKGLIKRPLSREWHYLRTDLAKIDQKQKGILLSELNSLNARAKKRKLNVLEWGCGEGFASFDCAQKFSNLRVFGFSRDSYYKWLEFLRYNDKGNLNFIFSSHKVFERYLSRRKLKFNLIFEHSSLVHLFQLDLVKHLNVLVKHLAVGGKIFVSAIDSPNWADFSEIKKELTKMGVSVSVNGFGAACLTRVK